MEEKKDELLYELTKGNIRDLEYLYKTDYDFCDIVDYASGMEDITVNGLLYATLKLATQDLEDYITDRLEEIKNLMKDLDEDTEEYGELQGERNDLESLNVEEDIEIFCNYIDTYIYIINNMDIYNKYLDEEIKRISNRIGFTRIESN